MKVIWEQLDPAHWDAAHARAAAALQQDWAYGSSMQMLGVQVLVTDPKELEQIRQRESDITKEKIGKIIAAGANVVMTTRAIDDLCQKYLVDAGVIGVRRCKRADLKRIAAATGGTLLPNLADLEGDESFDAKCLGQADEVSEERVGDGEVIFIRGCKTSRAVSVLLRGANEYLLDEMERYTGKRPIIYTDITFHKDVLDRASKDKDCREFAPDLKVELFLDRVDDIANEFAGIRAGPRIVDDDNDLDADEADEG